MDTRDTDVNVLLLPGQLFVGDARHPVRTLLGSCVSITLWEPQRKIGAMSHYLLGRNERQGQPLSGRYGEDALILMLRELAALGVAGGQCQAKIFGGGQMHAGAGVGQANGQAARRLLQQHGIPVVSENLFGAGHRNIIFNIRSGDVWSRQVDPATLTQARNQESACPRLRS